MVSSPKRPKLSKDTLAFLRGRLRQVIARKALKFPWPSRPPDPSCRQLLYLGCSTPSHALSMDHSGILSYPTECVPVEEALASLFFSAPASDTLSSSLTLDHSGILYNPTECVRSPRVALDRCSRVLFIFTVHWLYSLLLRASLNSLPNSPLISVCPQSLLS